MQFQLFTVMDGLHIHREISRPTLYSIPPGIYVNKLPSSEEPPIIDSLKFLEGLCQSLAEYYITGYLQTHFARHKVEPP